MFAYQPDNLAAIGLPFAFLSLLTSILLITAFFLDSQHSSKLSIKLLFCVQVCDALQAFGFVLIIPVQDDDTNGWCGVQAFFLQFGSLSSILCRLATTIVLYLALNKDESFFNNLEPKLFTSVVILSLVFTIMFSLFIFDYHSLNFKAPFAQELWEGINAGVGSNFPWIPKLK